MNILVLGASGLVGSNLVIYLEKKGHKVFTSSLLEGDYILDLSDYQSYEKVFGDDVFDAVVCCSVSYAEFLPDALQNLSVPANIISYFQEKTKQIVFVSSFSALEENKHQSTYNFTKYLSEKIIEKYSPNSCTLRFGQIIDLKEGSRKAQRGFHYFIDAINENLPFNIFAKNDTKRTYVSIEYVCEAIEYALEHQLKGFHNIVIEPLLSLQELSDLLLEEAPQYNNQVLSIDKEALNYFIPKPSEYFTDFVKDKKMNTYLKQFIKK